jgi:apolipoprotein D and lipocalin family protein
MFLCGTNLNPSLFMAPVFLAAIMAMLGFGAANARASDSELKVVDHVDVNRYVGTWYEIAKMPVFFQRDCAGGTTATYKLLKEGTISVVNRCCEADKEL